MWLCEIFGHVTVFNIFDWIQYTLVHFFFSKDFCMVISLIRFGLFASKGKGNERIKRREKVSSKWRKMDLQFSFPNPFASQKWFSQPPPPSASTFLGPFYSFISFFFQCKPNVIRTRDYHPKNPKKKNMHQVSHTQSSTQNTGT